MKPSKRWLNPTNIMEVLQTVVRELLPQLISLPEIATFSGNATDVIVNDVGVYLRLQRTMVRDAEGKPHELLARLCGPNGEIVIPDVETEMLVFHPAQADEVAGAAWALYGVRRPPQTVTQTTGRQNVSLATKVLKWAGGWCFRGGPGGNSFFTIDRDTGDVVLSLAGGSYIALSAQHNAIELKVTNGAKPTSTTLAALRIDSTGILLTAGAAAFKVGSDGVVQSVGSGAFIAAHPGGCLGPTPAFAVGVGPAGASSLTWKIAS